MNPILRGLGLLIGAATDLKNAAYDRGWKKPVRCRVPVISVGNLTVGGTGKTPVVDFLARRLIAAGRRPAIVCRSYRASAREPARVRADRADLFGDEACWYARRLPAVPVWSGPRKADTARAAAHAEDIDVILLDDGFQHRALHRDLNLVLLDATDGPNAYRLFPEGRAREERKELRRADAVIFTKTDLAAAPEFLRADIGGRPVFEFASRLRTEAVPPQGPLLAVSGIARPDGFLAMLKRAWPGRDVRELIFRDHHAYGPGDAARIAARARDAGAVAVVTTEKDDLKLRSLWTDPTPLVALSLEVHPRASLESMDGLLGQVFRQDSL